MEFLLSGRFIVGLILGAFLYHFWMMKRSRKGM